MHWQKFFFRKEGQKLKCYRLGDDWKVRKMRKFRRQIVKKLSSGKTEKDRVVIYLSKTLI